MKRFLAIATLLSAFLVAAFAHAGPFDFLERFGKRDLERLTPPSEVPIMTICSSAFSAYKAALPKVAACDEAAKLGVEMGMVSQSEDVACEEGEKERWKSNLDYLSQAYNTKYEICNDLPGLLESKMFEPSGGKIQAMAVQLPILTKVAMGILKDMEFKVCQACGNWPDGSSGHPCAASTEAISSPMME
jgi:hypothetical protein